MHTYEKPIKDNGRLFIMNNSRSCTFNKTQLIPLQLTWTSGQLGNQWIGEENHVEQGFASQLTQVDAVGSALLVLHCNGTQFKFNGTATHVC